MSGRDRIAAARAHWHWLIPAGVIFGLLTPLLFTDRTFSTDWGNHLWLIWVQGRNIADLGEPSYFLQSNLGAFYPYYAFYGGSTYAALGFLSEVFGLEGAVLIGYAGALAAAYLGWTWIAMQLGVRGWQAQLPGCIAVTAPLAMTNLYGRGDIPEAIATSMIPLVAASGLQMLRERRVKAWPGAAYVLAVAVLTGTHTLTLVWGVVFVAVCMALLAACYWRSLRARSRGVLQLAGLTVLGAAINAWMLMPLVLYHSKLIERDPDPINLTAYTDPQWLFSLFRDAGDPYPVVTADINAQLPVLALLWALFCGVLYWRFVSPPNRRLALGLLVLGGGLLLLVLSPSLISELPRAMQFIQFPYRILTYVDLVVVGLVTLALAGVQRDKSTSLAPVLALAAIATFNFVLSVDQSFDVRSWLLGREEAHISSVTLPRTWYASRQFADGMAPVVEPSLDSSRLLVGDGGDAVTAVYPPGPAGTVETNVATGPYFVSVSGARAVGRTEDGLMVVALPRSPDRPRRVVVRAAWGTAMTVGRWLTVLSLTVALALAAAAIAVRRRRGRGPGERR
jgi:hypothetical protein